MDKKLLALIMLFFISFAFFAAVTIFNKPITELTRAKEDLTPSVVRSKILAWPFPSVKADGISESVISVFVISESDKPLENKVVTLSNNLGQLRQTTATTDNNGKATFNITSTTPGIAELEATVEPNIKLSQKLSIKFE
ncbi:Ig-like domain-containing protein [Candidatus Roizmanbacteria bacterium]|nr:Ig-like domain-containing protein [Candidatus Roizmanbacteria bacterium]